MDAQGNIYKDVLERIPFEDQSRLDGYLRGRAEDGEKARLMADLEAKEAKLAKLEAERDG